MVQLGSVNPLLQGISENPPLLREMSASYEVLILPNMSGREQISRRFIGRWFCTPDVF